MPQRPAVVQPLAIATTTHHRRRGVTRDDGAIDQTLETPALVMTREAATMRTLQRIEIVHLVLQVQRRLAAAELLQTATIQPDGANEVSAEDQAQVAVIQREQVQRRM